MSQGDSMTLCVLIPATLLRKAHAFSHWLVSCHHVDQVLG